MMSVNQTISLDTSPSDILQMIKESRERKERGFETLAIVEKAIETMHDYIVNLYFERAHIFQLEYMKERDKPRGGNSRKMKNSLSRMGMYVDMTRDYIISNRLTRWISRLNRFYGRVADYRGKFADAVKYYEVAIRYSRRDPEYKSAGVPRWLELEGFLANSMMGTGNYSEGLKAAKKTYEKYDKTKAGGDLKRNDYTTWAIWKSGIPIHALQKMIEGGVDFDKEEFGRWLAEAEKILNPGKRVKTWADFQFRKDEINRLKKLLY